VRSAHSVEGLYLPYQADRAAAVDRARPKQSKLVTNQKLRLAVDDGLTRPPLLRPLFFGT
jgi:IS30 family transposase